MRFLKTDNIYKIVRITGAQDNILGVVFDDKDTGDNDNIEVIEWDFPKLTNSKLKTYTSKEEVLNQVKLGLKSINQCLKTNYKLSKIYFTSFDIPANGVYSGLIASLIRHYHNGNEFEEV